MKNRASVVRILQTAPLGQVARPAIRLKTTPSPVRWAFLLFVFTIPFEAQDLGILSDYLSLAKITGLFFFTVYFFYHNPFSPRRFPSIPKAVRWIMGYFAVYVVSGLFIAGETGDFLVRLITLAQLLVFLWIASDLLRENRLATMAFFTYSVGVAILALAVIIGIPGLSGEVTAGRTTALKEDLNQLATHMGMAVIILIGLYSSSAFKRFSPKLMVVSLALLPLVAIAKTGSRGGLAAFIVGLLVFLAPYTRLRWRLTPVLVGILIIVSAGYMVATNPDFVERWYQSYYEGRLAGREDTYPTAVEMVLERPLLGWHRLTWYELGLRQGELGGGDPHNFLLHLLLEVGLIGTIPFLIGLWLCGRMAWRARRGHLGLMPLALFMTMLVANMSITAIPWKPLWFVLALTLGSGQSASGSPKPSVKTRVQNWARTQGGLRGAKRPSLASYLSK